MIDDIVFDFSPIESYESTLPFWAPPLAHPSIPSFNSCDDPKYIYCFAAYLDPIPQGRSYSMALEGGVSPYTWTCDCVNGELLLSSTVKQTNVFLANDTIECSVVTFVAEDACGNQASICMPVCTPYHCSSLCYPKNPEFTIADYLASVTVVIVDGHGTYTPDLYVSILEIRLDGSDWTVAEIGEGSFESSSFRTPCKDVDLRVRVPLKDGTSVLSNTVTIPAQCSPSDSSIGLLDSYSGDCGSNLSIQFQQKGVCPVDLNTNFVDISNESPVNKSFAFEIPIATPCCPGSQQVNVTEVICGAEQIVKTITISWPSSYSFEWFDNNSEYSMNQNSGGGGGVSAPISAIGGEPPYVWTVTPLYPQQAGAKWYIKSMGDTYEATATLASSAIAVIGNYLASGTAEVRVKDACDTELVCYVMSNLGRWKLVINTSSECLFGWPGDYGGFKNITGKCGCVQPGNPLYEDTPWCGGDVNVPDNCKGSFCATYTNSIIYTNCCCVPPRIACDFFGGNATFSGAQVFTTDGRDSGAKRCIDSDGHHIHTGWFEVWEWSS